MLLLFQEVLAYQLKTIKTDKKHSKKIPIFWSPNMSIGANILKQVASEISI